jgi:hypothetical protein
MSWLSSAYTWLKGLVSKPSELEAAAMALLTVLTPIVDEVLVLTSTDPQTTSLINTIMSELQTAVQAVSSTNSASTARTIETCVSQLLYIIKGVPGLPANVLNGIELVQVALAAVEVFL